MDINLFEQKQLSLLKIIQSDFPVAENPYKVIAETISDTEENVIENIRNFITDGLVRNISPIFESSRLGYKSTLVAVAVDNSRVPELAAFMLSINEITHNYLRNHPINMWFTITAIDDAKVMEILDHVRKFPGVVKVMDLPVIEFFKIRAVFGETEKDYQITRRTESWTSDNITISDEDKNFIRFIQKGLPIVDNPFKQLAEITGISEKDAIDKIKNWITDGTIRRFGARLNHRKAGYEYNVLAVWKGENTSFYGKKFAEIQNVTHCYRRQSNIDWPYDLYTMIHARDEKEMDEIIQRMVSIAPDISPLLLKSLYELKKTTMKYFTE